MSQATAPVIFMRDERLKAEAAIEPDAVEVEGPAGTRGTLLEARLGDLKLFVHDAPELFDRDGGPYSDAQGNDYTDNWLRFAAFSKLAADIALGLACQDDQDIAECLRTRHGLTELGHRQQ